MSITNKKSARVLGVAATARAVHAVLLENGPDGPEVVRTFSRQRVVAAPVYDEPISKPSATKADSFGGGDDFTIEFGDGNANASNNLFLASEFGGIDDEDADGAGSAGQVSTFEFELGDILAEVSDAGYGDAMLAFTLSVADAAFAEVRLTSGKRADRSTLVDALTDQHKGVFDDNRVAFLPMTPGDGGISRFLAVFPKTVDAVTATIKTLREGTDRIPALALVDAEVSVLVGLARAAKEAFRSNEAYAPKAAKRVQLFDDQGDEETEVRAETTDSVNTLVVRAGAEDTLVLFMSGETVHQCEILRSLTAFDQADTICSRVLLQQDEHGVGDVHHVLVLSEEREAELAETFELFFPDAKVEMLRSYLPPAAEDGSDAATAVVSAMGSALRTLQDSGFSAYFEDVNFLPKKLARRKVKLPISKATVALSVLIVLTTLFFMTRYSTAETEIATYRDKLEEVAPEEVNTDITVLQARIDSMQNLYQTYTRAIEVLDTLLIGSDRWSRLLENTSKEASKLRGLWVESFQPAGIDVKINGNATSREEVVLFASRVNGTIESLLFSEIREWPVYTYTMTIPVTDSLPEAARYLREGVKIGDAATTETNDSRNAAGSQTKKVKL